MQKKVYSEQNIIFKKYRQDKTLYLQDLDSFD